MEKIWAGRKKYFSNVLRSLEKLSVLSQNFCIPSRNFAFSCKTFAFPRIVHSFILNLDSSIKKYNQCLDQGMVLGHSKTLNVA